MDQKVEIRKARIDDLSSITEIYNWAILNTTATFDTYLKTETEQLTWYQKHHQRLPVFVAVFNGQVVGWASLNSWSDRSAYDDTAEVSLYIKETFHGKGIGKALLAQLESEAKSLGFHTLISRITSESQVSIHLHESLGFQHIGIMKEVGRKFGRLLDVIMMQKIFR